MQDRQYTNKNNVKNKVRIKSVNRQRTHINVIIPNKLIPAGQTSETTHSSRTITTWAPHRPYRTKKT